MRKQKTIEVNGERIRIVARSRTYVGNANGYNVAVQGKEYYVGCLSVDEAMDKALARFLEAERKHAMKKPDAKVETAAWPRMTKDEIVQRMNSLGADRIVKVLLFERPGDATGTSEGVWVIIARGDQDAGIGMLMSNVVSLDGDQPARGDVVEYRTVNPAHKPYVVAWVDGKNN